MHVGRSHPCVSAAQSLRRSDAIITLLQPSFCRLHLLTYTRLRCYWKFEASRSDVLYPEEVLYASSSFFLTPRSRLFRLTGSKRQPLVRLQPFLSQDLRNQAEHFNAVSFPSFRAFFTIPSRMIGSYKFTMPVEFSR